MLRNIPSNIRNQCGSHIIHGTTHPLAFQQNYSRYDGPSESGSFFTLSKPGPNVISPYLGIKGISRGAEFKDGYNDRLFSKECWVKRGQYDQLPSKLGSLFFLQECQGTSVVALMSARTLIWGNKPPPSTPYGL